MRMLGFLHSIDMMNEKCDDVCVPVYVYERIYSMCGCLYKHKHTYSIHTHTNVHIHVAEDIKYMNKKYVIK